MCNVMARDVARAENFSLARLQRNKYEGKGLPWPEGALVLPHKIFDRKSERQVEIVLPRTEMKDAHGKIISIGPLVDQDYDALHAVLLKIIPRMDTKIRSEIGTWVLDHMQQLHAFEPTHADKMRFYSLVFEDLPIYESEALPIGQRIVAHLTSPAETTELSEIHMYFNQSDVLPLIYRALAVADDEVASRTVIGSLLLNSEIPHHINTLRAMLKTGKLSAQEVSFAEGTLRRMLGISPDKPLYRNLSDLYSAVSFENYQPNVEMRAMRLNRVVKRLEKSGVKKDSAILDLACGTGDLVADLRAAGYTNVIGIDSSKVNIEKAIARYGLHFELGSWNQLADKYTNAFKAIICDGRSLPHAESTAGLIRAIQEMQKATRNLLMVSMPDPERGQYWQSILRYREVLRYYGVPEYKLADYWYIVDGPTDRDFYNRIVPPKAAMLSLFSQLRQGFALLDVQEAAVSSGEGNVEFFYTLKKPRKLLRKELEEAELITRWKKRGGWGKFSVRKEPMEGTTT